VANVFTYIGLEGGKTALKGCLFKGWTDNSVSSMGIPLYQEALSGDRIPMVVRRYSVSMFISIVLWDICGYLE
jgi:hypothetical protein